LKAGEQIVNPNPKFIEIEIFYKTKYTDNLYRNYINYKIRKCIDKFD